MATVNLGAIKFNWKGAYDNTTAYVVDDVVSSGGNSYVCILASTGNAVTNATYWELMAQKGTDTSVATTQGDVIYQNGTSLARLGAGTSGQALVTGGTGANPSWSTISSGTYSVHRIDSYSEGTVVTSTAQDNHVDIANGKTVNFTPTHADDFIFLTQYCSGRQGADSSGFDVYLNMGTSSSLWSSDTKLNYTGNHAHYYSGISDGYVTVSKSIMLPCTNLTVATTYYVEQAGATHNANEINFNRTADNNTGYISGMQLHHVTMTHYKKN